MTLSNTIRLTSERGDVRWGKSLSYDGDALAERTQIAWIAHDIDWPDRDDYPRWYVPRGRQRPGRDWIGSIVREADGSLRFPGPLDDDQVHAIADAGATVVTELRLSAHRYDDEGATSHYQYVDWTAA